MSITCPDCNIEIEDIHDTTYSNMNSERCSAGDHTGNIYLCPCCDGRFIDNFLSGEIEEWSY